MGLVIFLQWGYTNMTMATSSPWSIFRYEKGNVEPTLTIPGETVVWERGEGKGEFYEHTNEINSTKLYAGREIGQSFTLGTVSLDGDFMTTHVIFRMYRYGAGCGTITAELKETVDGLPIGSALASDTHVSGGITTNSAGEDITFIWGTPYLMKAGTKYCIRFTCSAGDLPTNGILFKLEINGTYEGGTTFNGATGSPAVFDNYDFDFSTWGGGKFLLIHMDDGENYQAALTKVL